MRLGLADGSGAWWFRYLLTNPGRSGCRKIREGGDGADPMQPVQVWATWFPAGGPPQTLIQDFPLDALELTGVGISPFCFKAAKNAIDESSCEGALDVSGHTVAWNLHYRSTFRTSMSDKGWIGFSRTPHSNAVFSGQITFDGRVVQGNPLAYGLQGHNCGYRHRKFWTWAHLYFVRTDGSASTLEALTYEMPFGMKFRKAVLWHESKRYVLRALRETSRDQQNLAWHFECVERNFEMQVAVDGSGPNKHCLPYMKTDCSGTFDVRNNSLARARISIERPNRPLEIFNTTTGAVIEMVGPD